MARSALEVIDQNNVAWILIRCEALSQPLRQFGGVERCTGLDKELDVLLANFAGDGDHGAFGNSRMLGRHASNLEGADVFAPHARAVTVATVEHEIAVAVETANVTSMEGAVT
jgi:hypothetical protein